MGGHVMGMSCFFFLTNKMIVVDLCYQTKNDENSQVFGPFFGIWCPSSMIWLGKRFYYPKNWLAASFTMINHDQPWSTMGFGVPSHFFSSKPIFGSAVILFSPACIISPQLTINQTYDFPGKKPSYDPQKVAPYFSRKLKCLPIPQLMAVSSC